MFHCHTIGISIHGGTTQRDDSLASAQRALVALDGMLNDENESDRKESHHTVDITQGTTP